MTITNFDQADAQLTGRCKNRRKVDNNTYLERRDNGDIAVKLHNTDVVTYKPNGDVVLNSGGWRTYTTKDRINKFAPIRWLSQERGVWYVMNWEGVEVGYDDGMVVHPDGTYSGAVNSEDVRANLSEAEKIKRQIRNFVNSITPEQIVAALEDTGGDCLICKANAGGCEASHVEEQYFHGTLLYRAVKARGYRDTDFIMSMIYRQAQQGVVDRSFVKDTLARFLRKQMLQPMGLATV